MNLSDPGGHQSTNSLGGTLGSFFDSLFSGLLSGSHDSFSAETNARAVGARLLDSAIQTVKSTGSMALDFTPVIGDAKGIYEADGALATGVAIAVAAFGPVGDGIQTVRKIIQGTKVVGNTGGTVTLYRAVGVREYESIAKSGKFLPDGNSLEGRQFATTSEEAFKFADRDPNKVSVLEATVERSVLPSLDFSKAIDSFIFKGGVYTVQPGLQSDLFHSVLSRIEEIFP